MNVCECAQLEAETTRLAEWKAKMRSEMLEKLDKMRERMVSFAMNCNIAILMSL